MANFSGTQEDEGTRLEKFDFRIEMRETRAQVDELLSKGKIEEAESFMEERRLDFVANGFNIRKLNQAYFAFNGTYADSAASSSPIADQLKRYRDSTSDVGAFVKKVAGFSSYQEFLNGLYELD